MDPEELLSQLFGGEKFVPIIGNISLGRDMKTALQDNDSDEAGPKKVKGEKDLTPDEKAKKEEKSRKEAREVRVHPRLFCTLNGLIVVQREAIRQERVRKLVEELERKLSIFTESATGVDDKDVTQSWRTICELDAE